MMSLLLNKWHLRKQKYVNYAKTVVMQSKLEAFTYLFIKCWYWNQVPWSTKRQR